MTNPFRDLPLNDGGPKRRANLWRFLPRVAFDMMEFPGALAVERRARLKVDYRDITVCQHAMIAIGLVRMKYPDARTRSIYALTDRAEALFHRKPLAQLTAWAVEEHERQEAARIVPLAAAKPAAEQSERSEQPKSEWPKMLPCMHPACRKPHKATWAGDRYHPECRKAAGQMASNADSISSGYRVSPTGGRRPL